MARAMLAISTATARATMAATDEAARLTDEGWIISAISMCNAEAMYMTTTTLANGQEVHVYWGYVEWKVWGRHFLDDPPKPMVGPLGIYYGGDPNGDHYPN